MIIGFGCDPNAVDLKRTLMATAQKLGHEVRDYGSEDPIYPHTAIQVATDADLAGDKCHQSCFTTSNSLRTHITPTRYRL